MGLRSTTECLAPVAIPCIIRLEGGGMAVRITALVENLAGMSRVWAEHGLSLLVETENARVLLDTGASGQVLRHNVQDALSMPTASVDAVVLSHAHADHTGGLATALELFSCPRVVAHPAVFEHRIARRNDQLQQIGMSLTRQQIEERADLVLDASPLQVSPGVWTTGGILDRPHPVSGAGYLLVERGGQVIPDTYTDDMSLVVRTDGGLVLVLGCCHAGLLNTMGQVARTFDAPILAVVGGTHLGGCGEARLQEVGDALQSVYGAPRLHLCHCTSPELVVRLGQRLGADKVKYLSCGETIEV
jgi:7,8-dihydropterin-6-yl-methyl-4-(beta-D-ribofuranosyl)aminobenzene 5'-phosphate synthase